MRDAGGISRFPTSANPAAAFVSVTEKLGSDPGFKSATTSSRECERDGPPPSRLAALAQRREQSQAPAEERCELCAEPLAQDHRHLLDLQDRRLLCACRACTILFDRSGAGGRHYRLVPDRVRLVHEFELDDVAWQSLEIPVEMAFFFWSSAAERIVAFYPSPLGATESLLELDAWDDLVAANPVLGQLERDVEALLVNRARGAREHWLVPVDRCYELVGLVRTNWRGFAGGDEVWSALDTFFDELRRRAKRVTKEGKEATWHDSRSASRT